MKRAFSVALIGALLLSLLFPATALAYPVGPPLPTELQNGSFETNPWSTNTTITARDIPQTDLLGWSTSDPSGIIELWRTGMRPDSAVTFNALPGTGNWFCELNAQIGPPTYIYQDVATTPGALYQWSFYHRGRMGTDTAMMLLGPQGELTTAANAQPAFGGTEVPPGTGVTSPGSQYLVARNSEWAQHLGYYQPTTTATRYELYSYASVPAGTGAGRYAVGNLVDAAAWTMIAAPNTLLTLSGNPVDPNIVGKVNTTEGFQGKFAAAYDFVTPGTRNVTIDVYDSNDVKVGSVDCIVNVYVILTSQFINAAGVPIATSINAFFPTNFANNDPADFTAAGAFNYDISGSAPATFTDANTGITYLYRSLSNAGDPTGLSADESGLLSGNTTVTYVYVPQPQTLRVVLVDTGGNDLTALFTPPPIQTTLDNGSPYRVTAVGSVSDLDYPLELHDIVAGTTYYFKEIASMPGSALQLGSDPPTGTMDSDKTVYVVYELAPATYDVGGKITGLPTGAEVGIDVYYTIDGGSPLSVQTNLNGDYLIPGLQAGVEVIIFPPADQNIGGVIYRSDPIAGYDIPNLSTDVLDNDFHYLPTYNISGYVSGLEAEPTGNGSVPINVVITGPLGTSTNGGIHTDPSGFYSISNVPAGSTVVITAPATITPAAGAGVYAVQSSAGNILTVNIVDADLTDQNFVYGLSYTVSGSVFGLPELQDIVISYSIDGVAGTTKTDVFGNYSILYVPAGSVVKLPPLPNVPINGTTFLAAPILGYANFVVNADVLNKNFTYVPTHSASGQVSGLPNNGGIVISYTITMPISLVEISGTVQTEIDGSYTIETIPDRSGIVITAPTNIGNYTYSPAGGYAVAQVVADAPDNNFLYMRALYTVGGNVSGLANNSGVTVNYSIDGSGGSTVTDVNGDYRIDNVPAGAHVVINAPATPTGYVVSPAAGYTLISITGDSLHNDFIFTKTDTPPTGDAANPLLPLGLLITGLLSLTAGGILKRQNRIAATK